MRNSEVVKLGIVKSGQNKRRGLNMKLTDGKKGVTYTVKSINGNNEMNTFLFSLGCFEGEVITIIRKRGSGYIVSIKDGRYGIDKELAGIIEVEKYIN